MADAPAPDDAEPPGKRRTLWHPILVALLEWALRDSCEVRDEVSVGRMPLRLDIVLVRRLESPIPEAAFQSLSAISRRLNAYTLIEFKSPTDALEYGDWNKLAGCAHLFLAQSGRTLRAADLTRHGRDFRKRGKHDAHLIGDADTFRRPGARRERAADPNRAFVQVWKELGTDRAT